MAEKTTVFNVQFDTDQAIKNIDKAEKEVARLKQEFAALSEEEQKNVATKEKFNSQIRILNKDIRDNRKVIDQTIKTTGQYNESLKANDGSITQMREQLKLMTREYVSLSEAERENTEVGGKKREEIEKLTNKLKEKEQQIGQNFRNVGNYTESIESASGRITIFGVNIGSLIGGLKEKKKMLEGLNPVQRGFGATMAAIPIFALIAAIGLVISYFTRFQKGMDAVSRVMAGLSAGMDVLLDVFSELGEVIINNLMMRLQALGRVIKGLVNLDFEEMKAGFADLTQEGEKYDLNLRDIANSMGEAARAAAELERRQQKLRDATIAAIVDDQRRENQIKELMAAYRDEQIALEDRLDMLDQASEIEQQLHQEQLQRAKERFEIAKLQDDISSSTAEDLEELARLEAEYIKLQGESNMLQMSIAERRGKLIRRVRQEEQRAAEQRQAELERQAEAELRIQDMLEDAIIANIEDATQRQIRQLQVQHERRMRAIEGNSEEEIELRKQLELAFQREMQIIDEQVEAAEQAKHEEELALIEQRAKARLEVELQQLEENTEAFFEKMEEIAELEREHRIAKIEQEVEDEELRELLIQQVVQESEDKITQIRLNAANQRLQNEKMVNDARLMAEQETMNALQSLAQFAAEMGEAGAAFAKTVALFEIGANTAQAISQAVVNAQAAAAAGGPAAPFLAAAYTASGIASVLTAVNRARKLLSQESQPKAPKLAEGGGVTLSGKSHSQGGIPIYAGNKKVAEAEDGENLYVLKRTASDYVNALSGINQAFGGNSFGSGRTGLFQDGGQVAMTAGNDVDRRVDVAELTRSALAGLPTPVVRVSEINQVQGDVGRSVEVSGL